MTDVETRSLLKEVHKVAIIGAKDALGEAVTEVGHYLIRNGFEVYPVHPLRSKVWGIDAVPVITDLKVRPDAVVLFRAPQYCAGHAEEVLRMPELPDVFWMQLGISSPEARILMTQAGVAVVENRCIMVEHRRIGG